MRIKVLLLVFTSILPAKETTPAEFWSSYNKSEKIAFVNGSFGAFAKLKSHHKSEVKKQYMHDDNWREPYFIERFYDIIDEYIAKEIGYNLEIIVMHLDAFYTNSDNIYIPILEALRIVSLIQDGEKKIANTRLLKSQHKHKRN